MDTMISLEQLGIFAKFNVILQRKQNLSANEKVTSTNYCACLGGIEFYRLFSRS